MRTYGDGCSSAHALDLVGERWALLIVRDLLFGPKRFSDLTAGLPQGSPNVLTSACASSETAGIVRRRKLPPPASTMVYELTAWGAELEPILLGLQRWGCGVADLPARRPGRMRRGDAGSEERLRLSPAIDGPDRRHRGALRHRRRSPCRWATGAIDIRRGAADRPSVAVETDPSTLEQVAFGMRTLADDAEVAGDLRAEGDRAIAERFLAMFAVTHTPPMGV